MPVSFMCVSFCLFVCFCVLMSEYAEHKCTDDKLPREVGVLLKLFLNGQFPIDHFSAVSLALAQAASFCAVSLRSLTLTAQYLFLCTV